MTIVQTMLFQASQEQVWDLLTNPAMTKQYMFGCEVLSDWQIGSPINWKGQTEDGQEIIYVTGEVTAIDPSKSVSFTMFDPNMGLKDIPENYASLTYEVSTSDEGTSLTLTQSYVPGAENGQKRYEDSLKGWEMILPAMKQLVES
ncbi:MAG: SRPBCC domain-containing protein [Bacteroidota bacterium]